MSVKKMPINSPLKIKTGIMSASSTKTSTTAGNIIPIYTVNNRKMEPDKISKIIKIKSPTFQLTVNGLCMQITNDVKDLKVTPQGVFISY